MTMRIHGDKIEFPDGTEQFTASTGSGGDVEAQPAVVFRGVLINDQVVDSEVLTKVNLGTAIIDSHNSLVDGTFKPSVAGYYQVSGSVQQACSPQSTRTLCALWKNGGWQSHGTAVEGTVSYSSTVSDVVYLDPKHEWTDKDGNEQVGDYLELRGFVKSTGTCKIQANALKFDTYLSAHLISSITEGEVKEKEAVVMRAGLSANQTATKDTWTKVNLNKICIDSTGKKVGNDADLVDGKFKPSVAGYYQVNGTLNQSGSSPTSTYTSVQVRKNNGIEQTGSTVQLDANGVYGSLASVLSDVIYLNGEDDFLELFGLIRTTGTAVFHTNTNFSAHLITGQSSGGGTGGGSYTPEKMVWSENLSSMNDGTGERDFATEYTNTNDVPLYININVHNTTGSPMYADMSIDGKPFGHIGGSSSSGRDLYQNGFFIIPAGSTYELSKQNNSQLRYWYEAKMPVAIGSDSGEATGTPSSFARIVDEKPASTHGGTSVTGMQDRTLNKIEYDKDNIVTLSEDKNFTLQAGTYVIDFSSPAHKCSRYASNLYSVTDSVQVAQGTSQHTNNTSNSASNRSMGSYYVTLTKPNTYKVRQYIQHAKEADGLGVSMVSGVGIFTTVDIQKVGTGGASSGGGSTEVYGTAKVLGTIKSSEITGTEAVPTMNGVYGSFGIKGVGKISTGLYYIEFEDDLFEDNNFTVQTSTSSGAGTGWSAYEVSGLRTKNSARITTINATAVKDVDELKITVFDNKPVLVSGGSGGGTPTDILPVLYSGVVNTDGTVIEGTGFTSVKVSTGTYTITLDKPVARTSAIHATLASSVGTVGYLIEGDNQIKFYVQDRGYVDSSNRKDGIVSFTVTGTETISVGGGTGGGDSIWSDVDGDAVLETDGKKLTIDANVAELGAKARISTDTNSLEFNVGSGSLPEMTITSDGGVEVNNVTVGKIKSPGDISFHSNDENIMTIASGRLILPTTPGLYNTPMKPNMFIDDTGVVIKSVAIMYSAEEVDKKLTIKDKLIEKLSARLDELEKKLK